MAKILVLDDMAETVVLIQTILGTKGHDVTGFTDEEQAIAYARSRDVDLLILDVKLKKLSGLDVLREIKRLQPQVKAMILTGYPSLESAREAKDLGVQEYCIKPMEKEELEEKAAQVLAS
ncbi:MAG: response regulator [Deltaproteobacteria bacterium]|nr:response regulator [Deltaproteobacteria bacterium]